MYKDTPVNPLMFRLKQRFRCNNRRRFLGRRGGACKAGSGQDPGESVAVTCSSRRIANHAVILKAVVDQRL
jgi:hypothetical protein